MPTFSLDRILLTRRLALPREDVFERVLRVLGRYEPLGYTVDILQREAPRLIRARVHNDGTDLPVLVVIEPELGGTYLEVELRGVVHVGGLKGQIAGRDQVRRIAREQLQSLLDRELRPGPGPSAEAETDDESSSAASPNGETREPRPEEEDREAPEAHELPRTSSGFRERLGAFFRTDYQSRTEAERQAAVKEVIRLCSIAAAAVSIQPFPIVDTALISPIQIAMVEAISRVRGRRIDTRTALELLGTLGVSLVARNVVLAVSKLIPVAGWAMGMSVAYALTYALGEAADLYFRGGSMAETEEVFRKTYETTRAEKVAAHDEDLPLKERLAQLGEAYEAGLITDDEFARKKEKMLADF